MEDTGVRPLVAGNWKMHNTSREALEFAKRLLEKLKPKPAVDVWVFPPFTLIPALASAFKGTHIQVGGQNMHHERKGAFTGEVSPDHLLDAGAKGVIIGHSERRQFFGETDKGVNLKLRSALAAGLRPIVCVGETLDQREAGRTAEVVLGQIRAGLEGIKAESAAAVALAYEPVWAIGTGRTATPDQAREVHALARKELGGIFGPAGAGIPILYGGSVKPENAKELMSQPDVNGCLVGGASLSADSFAGIVFGAL